MEELITITTFTLEKRTIIKPIKKNKMINRREFIKKVFFDGTVIIKNSWYEECGIHNKNLMFFLNFSMEKLSSISTLGCRLTNGSLIEVINNTIKYADDIELINDSKDKNFTISVERKSYIRDRIINSNILSREDIDYYISLLDYNNTQKDDKEFIQRLKLISKRLVRRKYFDKVSDSLYELLRSDKNEYSSIEKYASEYFLLLMDFIGISIYEIKRIFKNIFSEFFRTKDEEVFFSLFSLLASSYKGDNEYNIFVKMNKEYDDQLIISLKKSKKQDYILYSKKGLKKLLNSSNISSTTTLNKIIKDIESEIDNNYFIYCTLYEKDLWKAIKKFKQARLEPFIGTLIFSGIKVKTADDKYYVIEKMNDSTEKSIIDYEYHDDIYRPLTQSKIDYFNVFKRYIIDQNENEINKIIDEAIQLLPTYNDTTSVLSRFSNIWFALETLYRKTNLSMNNALLNYAAGLVADKMLSGQIHMTAIQIMKAYDDFSHFPGGPVENSIRNFDSWIDKDCDYLEWKIEKIKDIAINYKDKYKFSYNEARQLIDNIYKTRNKQFHGSKGLQLEYDTGHLYDIVNDTLTFFIDYLDVFKDENPNTDELYEIIGNIGQFKGNLISLETDLYKKLSILSDSIRKL